MVHLAIPALMLALGQAEPSLAERLDRIEKAIEKLVGEQADKITQLAVAPLRDEVILLRKQVSDLQYDLAQLRTQLQKPEGRKTPDATPVPQPGLLELVNDYSAESMHVEINGLQTVSVPPMARMTLQIPAGNFTYRVVQTDPVAKPRQLAPGQKLTVTLK